MRRLFVFMMVSIDGYFEGVNHDFSWSNADNQEFEDFALENLSNTDALVMGHRTYDVMETFWPTDEAKESDPRTAAFMTNTMKYVASRQGFEPEWENVTVKVGDPVAWVQELKQADGKDIAILASSELCVSLIEANVIDEYQIMYNPLALGAGTPVFNGLNHRVDFELLSSRPFKNGNVLLTYKRK